jgi:outer membrane murein-binding lipoprotein Lpp
MFDKGEKISPIEYGKALVKAELLSEEVERLRAQVDRLQEALVAATAPHAYAAIQQDKANQLELTMTPAQEKDRKDKEEENNFLKDYLENLEKPTFQDADDLVSSLGKLIGVTQPEPLHLNSEN